MKLFDVNQIRIPNLFEIFRNKCSTWLVSKDCCTLQLSDQLGRIQIDASSLITPFGPSTGKPGHEPENNELDLVPVVEAEPRLAGGGV